MREDPIILKRKKVEEILHEPAEDFRDNRQVKKILAAFLNELVASEAPVKNPSSHPSMSISQVGEVLNPEAEKVFAQVEIHGDRFMGKWLTKELLREEGLTPKHVVVIDGVVTWLSSSAYNLGHGRVAVMAYVKKDGKIVARSYYRSNSQGGIWRFMPDYLAQNGHLVWYGKGWSEEGVTLPSVLQEALAKISAEGMPILDVSDPELIFAGAARNHYGDQQATYVHETESEPKNLKGTYKENYRTTEDSIGDKMNPRKIVLSPEDSPDFSNLLASWKQNTSLYGLVTLEVFPSKDGRLKFTFCKTEDGRAMVGAIEDDSEMQSTGLRKSWVQGGDLTTPIFEYRQQAGKYGNYNICSGNYVDMFENYLSKIPVIQEYLGRNPLELIR